MTIPGGLSPDNPFAPQGPGGLSPDNPFAHLQQPVAPAEATAQAPIRPGKPPALQIAENLAQTVLDIPKIATGTIRHVARTLPGIASGQGIQYLPTTPDELQDASHFLQGTALAASVAVGGLVSPAVESVLGAGSVVGSGGAQTLLRGLRSVAAAFTRGAAAGEVYGAIRPTRQDETRLNAILYDAIGFGAIDAGMRGVLSGALALSGTKMKPLPENIGDVFAPTGLGKIVSSPVHLQDDLVKVGLEPERALAVIRGQTPLAQAWTDQFAGRVAQATRAQDDAAVQALQQQAAQGVQATQAAAAQRGFSWIADGRPVEAWPNHGEMFVAAPTADGQFLVHVANATDAIKGHGIGPTIESALADVRGLPESGSLPVGTISETGAAVTSSPLTLPPSPEFSGFFGGLRYLSQSMATDRFAGVRAFSEKASAAMNNQAASQISTGYTGLLIKRFAGVEGLDQADRDLLGAWFNARESVRTRARFGARISEAQQRVADLQHYGSEGATHTELQQMLAESEYSALPPMPKDPDAAAAYTEARDRWAAAVATAREDVTAAQVAARESLGLWTNALEHNQRALAAVTIPELTQQQALLFAQKPVVQGAQRFIDEHIQPWLEHHKFMTGLSLGQLEAGTFEDPILSLVAKRGVETPAEAGIGEPVSVEATVSGAPTRGAGTGTGAPIQSRYRVGATRAAQMRTGTGEYETDISTMIDSWLQDVMPKLSKRATMETITSLPGVRLLKRGESPGAGFAALEFQGNTKFPGLDVTGTWRVPKAVADGYNDLSTRRNLLSTSPLGNTGLAALDFFTQLQLAAPVEASSHAWRIASQLSGVPGIGPAWMRALTLFPSLGPKSQALYDIFKTGSDPVAFTQTVQQLARIGALTGRPLSEEAHGRLFAWLDQSQLLQTPRRFLFGMPQIAPGLDGFETRVRVAGYNFIQRLTRDNLGRAATDNEVRQFVNGWGTYGTEMQATPLAILRKYRVAAFGSFQTSAIPREMTRMLGWLLPGTSGGTGLPQSIWRNLPLTKQMMMRTEVAWRGLIGDMTFRALTTKAATGYWPWDTPHLDTGHMTDVAVGSVGQGDDQRFVYAKGNIVDPGITRAWRTTGARAIASGLLHKDLWGGAQQVLIDYANVATGLLSPWTRFATVGAFGKAAYFTPQGDLMQQSDLAPTAGGQLKNNALMALAASNPIIAQVAEERNAVRNLPGPLAQVGAMALNALTPGMTVGPPRKVWAQLNVQRQQARVLDYVNQQVSRIVGAPTDEEHDRLYHETQETIQGLDLPGVIKTQALQGLRQDVLRRPRTRAKRARIAAEP